MKWLKQKNVPIVTEKWCHHPLLHLHHLPIQGAALSCWCLHFSDTPKSWFFSYSLKPFILVQGLVISPQECGNYHISLPPGLPASIPSFPVPRAKLTLLLTRVTLVRDSSTAYLNDPFKLYFQTIL